ATAVKNLTSSRAPTGILQGAISPQGTKYGADATVLEMLLDLTTRTLAAQPVAAVASIANAKVHGMEKVDKQGNHAKKTDQNPFADLMSYKARPLNGI